MIGRNDPCLCGSGKKYKKCCESKQAVSIEEVQSEELERILQTFYEEYPERKDINEFMAVVKKWSGQLDTYYVEEMIEAIVLDEFFFHHKPEIWKGYLGKQQKKVIRPTVEKVLNTWRDPRIFIGEVVAVDDNYMSVKNIMEDETILLRRESEKPVPVGVHLYCFILPDGTSKENHYLAVSSLIFFPTDHSKVFEKFVAQFESQKEQSVSAFLKENEIAFWKLLGEDGYDGGEFTNFEAGVLQKAIEFLEKNDRDSEELLEIIEDFLVEKQPNARKDVAIAAGAIRFGQDNAFFESLDMTVKEIADWFGVSTSSLNRYYNDIITYYKSEE
ncbi:YecA family protein [Sporosarcina sp. G11-34]|uniref:YecA family protein n=1 Tax=Sporosarcina sp. G11-34 TaxID=2849605 RepID=UPI0022A995DB|nr:SEC-C metal-binding domain-containing protein [Sporosarcina sp. G11-34]MCZ2258323.1 SEC-C domain-containing protein [Sporosarcina sp. G11-34]